MQIRRFSYGMFLHKLSKCLFYDSKSFVEEMSDKMIYLCSSNTNLFHALTL
jgi:hypothetical protein